MRKKIKLALSLIFVVVLGVMGNYFYKTYQLKTIQGRNLDNLPPFSLVDTRGKTVTSKAASRDAWTVFIFFNSECHYCQEEASQMKALSNGFDGIQFYWISSEPIQIIADFQKSYGLVDHTSITFLHDTNGVFAKKCNVTATPQFLVYDTSWVLVKNHKGAWRIDKLLEHIANEFKTP